MILQHGHSIKDPGHTHKDNGHNHQYNHVDSFEENGIIDGFPIHWLPIKEKTVTTATGFANLASSTTGLGVEGVTGVPAGALIGDEVRPKNMLVQFIIRIE